MWNVNETCAKLGEKCLQLLSLHYLTGSDTTSFLFGKGKIRALKILKNGLLPNLDTVLGEADTAQEELKTIGESFFCIMYGYPSGTKIGDVRYQMYTKKKSKALVLQALPPTEQNMFLHILRAHYQILLAKSAAKKVLQIPIFRSTAGS